MSESWPGYEVEVHTAIFTDNTDIDLADRVAGLLVLLFAQPCSRSSASPPTTSSATTPT